MMGNVLSLLYMGAFLAAGAGLARRLVPHSDVQKRLVFASALATALLAGLPALSMPCGFDSKGLPVGAQLIGAPLMEQKVLNAAHAFQQDTDYHTRRPGGEEEK